MKTKDGFEVPEELAGLFAIADYGNDSFSIMRYHGSEFSAKWEMPPDGVPTLEQLIERIARAEGRVKVLTEALGEARQHMLDSEFDPECIAIAQIDAAIAPPTGQEASHG